MTADAATPHPCLIDAATNEFDHDWHWVSDWFGDPGVVNGTADCSRWECKRCGEVNEDKEPPGDDDDFLYDHYLHDD